LVKKIWASVLLRDLLLVVDVSLSTEWEAGEAARLVAKLRDLDVVSDRLLSFFIFRETFTEDELVGEEDVEEEFKEGFCCS
jgi:hypothetical protein